MKHLISTGLSILLLSLSVHAKNFNQEEFNQTLLGRVYSLNHNYIQLGLSSARKVKAVGLTGECSGIGLFQGILLTAQHCDDSESYTLARFRIKRKGSQYSWKSNDHENIQPSGTDVMLFRTSPSEIFAPIKMAKTLEDLQALMKEAFNKKKTLYKWGRITGITSGHLLSGDLDENDYFVAELSASAGDSGGPIWIADTLVGIVSRGDGEVLAIEPIYRDLFSETEARRNFINWTD